MILPFHVLLPITTNTPQRLFNTTDNLILASMVSGSNNLLTMFGLGGITSLTNIRVARIRGAADTAGVLTMGVYSPNTTSYYEVWRSYLTDTRYFTFDDEFQPRSNTVFPADWLTVPQSNGYVLAMQWSTTPTGGGVNVAGEIQISNTVGQVTAAIAT
jgi:hypothetical protein